MSERIMLKVVNSDEYIVLRTVTETGIKSKHFYVSHRKIMELQTKHYIIVKDLSFAVFFHDNTNDTLRIEFYWINYDGLGDFKGYIQYVNIKYSDFIYFVNSNSTEYKAISIPESFSPKITFKSSRNLHEIVSNKLIRRKLSKFLRDRFNWASTEIIFFDDFVPYSFNFREYQNGKESMLGGLILHRQEDMSKAYYSIHT